ncbi:FadR/GntR family transcriptional regulator [Tessaracoccus lubricantis]|uniref:FadR/GntR family transcriptional regulator n=1 Tax=Tessaracoccus lubricantis TaxID=545543 RepID=A0ABP9FET1_9ACTN
MINSHEPQRLRQTTQAVKEHILREKLKPGDPMPTEVQLIEALGVSRSNLREAIRTLVTLDILEVRHGTGMFVGKMSLRPLVEGLAFKGVVLPGEDFETLRQIVEVRMALDQSLAPGVVERMSGGQSSELAALCDKMTEKKAAGESFATEDRLFHLNLAEVLSNELYAQLVAAFWDVHTLIAPRLGVPTPRDLDDTVDAHRAMLDAALAGDLEEYRAAVERHYAPLLRVLDSSKRAAQPAVAVS